jgi:hypothetical protein
MEYCLPLRISQSVEYQLPTPRPPMLRVPTALTSSSLPALMWGSSASPGEGRVSDFGWLLACSCLALSLICFLAVLESAGAALSDLESVGVDLSDAVLEAGSAEIFFLGGGGV